MSQLVAEACGSIADVLTSSGVASELSVENDSDPMSRGHLGVFFDCSLHEAAGSEGLEFRVEVFVEPTVDNLAEAEQVKRECCYPTDGSLEVSPVEDSRFTGVSETWRNGDVNHVMLLERGQLVSFSVRRTEADAEFGSVPADESVYYDTGAALVAWVDSVGGSDAVAAMVDP